MTLGFSDIYIDMPEQGSAPATPASGKVRLYVDNTGALKLKDDAGNVTGAGGASQLDDLSDVTITTPSDDQFLRYNGSAWVNETVAVPSNLDDLGDVTITTPSSDQVLKYNGSAWVNAAAPAATPTFCGVKAYMTTAAVTVDTVATYEYLTFDAEEFDTDSWHNTVTNNHEFVVPSGKTGYFFITLQSNIYLGTPEDLYQYYFGITLDNGSESDVAVFRVQSVSADAYTIYGTAIIQAAATNIIRFKLFNFGTQDVSADFGNALEGTIATITYLGA